MQQSGLGFIQLGLYHSFFILKYEGTVVYLQLSFGIKSEQVTLILIVADGAALTNVFRARRSEM